jgi:hypothetical protein
MSTHLASYLNDHLSGAMVAIELLDHLQKAHGDAEVRQFAAGLQAEIEVDRQELKRLIGELDIAESRIRQTAAWLTEKATRLKLLVDDPNGGDFLLFEILEALSLGIEGKASLWTALSAAAATSPALRRLDYDRLLARARDQRQRVDARRLALAPATLRHAEGQA